MLLSRGGITLAVWIAVFTVLTSIVIGLRLWAIRLTKRAFRPDDYMVFFAYISTLTLAGATWWAIANGLGAHTSELSNYELGVQFKLIVVSGVTWLLGTVFCKLSVLWLYTTLFTTQKFKYAAWSLMAVVGGYGIAFLCVFLTNCQPISQEWHPVPGGHCRDLKIEELASISLNMVMDTLIALLPMPWLWHLRMSARNKITITVMFGMGLLVVGIMAWRLQITTKSATNADFVYGLRDVGLVSFLELWLSMIVICIPTLAPLFARYVRPVVTRATGASKRTGEKRLREAQQTIGGGSTKRAYHWKTYGKLDADSYLELEEGNLYTTAEAVSRQGSASDSAKSWIQKPNAIGVTHQIHVFESETPLTHP